MTAEHHKWEELVSNIKVWKRGSQVAPHKPLLTLMLLARAQRREPRVVPFSEIDKPLGRLLKDFGPRRKSYHPEHPFWYLQGDGYWHVHSREALLGLSNRKKGKNEPSRGALLKLDPMGEVPEFLWRQLQDPSLVSRLAQRLLDECWPEHYHQEICSAVGLTLVDDTSTSTRRKRDPAFRDGVLRAYSRRCAVCGFDARIGDSLFGVEAAHIKWHQYLGPDVTPNGLALCVLHHKAFDRGAISLNDHLELLVSSDLSGHEMVRTSILEYEGRTLEKPRVEGDLPRPEFLDWHRKNVFRA